MKQMRRPPLAWIVLVGAAVSMVISCADNADAPVPAAQAGGEEAAAPPAVSPPVARTQSRPAQTQSRPTQTQSRPAQTQSRPTQTQSAPARTEQPMQPAAPAQLVVDGDPVVRLLPRDAIASLDEPVMVSAAEGDAFMEDDEPVLGVVEGGQARAYSTWHLDRHEVVNDTLGETPIAATW